MIVVFYDYIFEPMLFVHQAVNESCYSGEDSVLKSLVEIADTAPKYLRPNLEATLQLSLKVRS